MNRILTICISIILTSNLGFSQVNLGGKSFQNSFTSTQLPNLSKQNLIIAEFAKFPNAGERKELSSFGIEFLEYIPKNNYLLRVANTSAFEKLKNSNLKSWDYFSPKHKASVRLNNYDFPVYALVDESTVKLDVFPIDKSQLNQLQTGLINAGFSPELASTKDGFTVTSIINNIENLLAVEEVFFADITDAPATPENLVGKTDHRSYYINSLHPELPQYDGRGINVALGDDGIVGPHIDYTGRIDQTKASGGTAPNNDHGDHIAGTIMGAGNIDPDTRGMAPGSFLHVYNVWDAVDDSPQDYVTRNIRITSTSYSNGCNAGYTNRARNADLSTYNNSSLVHVFSAGNSNGSDCGYGAGNQWGNVTGGIKVGKNVIAVANLTFEDVIAPSSSRGPAHDGRIKPEVSAVGTAVYSTTTNNLYNTKTGTSMSCPGVSGTLAQLYDAFIENHGYEPPSGLMKAILMNTADDIGNPGPDFIHGYGRINARRAVDLIESGNFMSDSIDQGQTKTFNIPVANGAQDVSIMLHWTDVPAIANANTALVNDLDLTVTDPNSVVLEPWVLDITPNPTNLNTPAVRGRDSLNNQEQVTIEQPAPGTITVTVDGTSIPSGPQEFFIAYQFRDESITLTYPIGGEGFTPNGSEVIRWDARPGTSNFSLEYSTDSGSTWNLISNSINPDDRHYSWGVANTLTDEALIRVIRGGQSDESDRTFAIVGKPQNLQADWVCVDSMQLSWNNVAGINDYLVTKLGNEYMDSIAVTDKNSVKLYGINPFDENWFSVQSLFTSKVKGERALAIQVSGGVKNCPIDRDVNLTKVTYPQLNRLPNCLEDTASNLSIIVKNSGLMALPSASISYQINNGAVVTENYNQNINSGDSIFYTFSNPIDYTALPQNSTIRLWHNVAGDQNKNNDTLFFGLDVYSGTSVTPLYTQDFENFSQCGTQTNCEATICNLQDGWINLENTVEDDIDWRVDNGGTQSGNTGPDTDHNPGNTGGNYLYLEASGGCTFQTATMLSPCIQIPANAPVELSFWYHMFGAAMGDLHVDLMVNNNYIEDIIAPLVGNKGNQWLQQTVNLSAYGGQEVVVVFRGITGGDFTSDMALDDISIYAVSSAPTADFTSTNTSVCPGGVVKLYDNSQNAPTNWNWTITPNTFQFVNGTNANSQNPEIELLGSGNYDIKLTVSNPNGSDSTIKNSFVFSDAGFFPPIVQDFDNTGLPPQGWFINNPSGSYSWQFRFGVTGSNGNSTTCIFVNNYLSDDKGARDEIETFKIDLTNSANSFLTFDVAYVTNTNGNADGLAVEVSTDCGESFAPTTYNKSGANLATAAPFNNQWVPTLASDWRTDTLDLTPYLGKSVILRFVNINGHGNALHLDNINVYDFSPPKANFVYTGANCVGDSVVFEEASFGYQRSYAWDFGPTGNPATAVGPGPHNVAFSSAGPNSIELIVTNPLGADTISKSISLNEGPTAGLGTQSDSSGMRFTLWSASSNATNYQWFIGDSLIGQSDTAYIRFNAPGFYDITIVAINPCGTDTSSQRVEAINIGLNDFGKSSSFNVYPNPAKNMFTFNNPLQKQVEIELYDGRMRLVDFKSTSQSQINWDISNLVNGVYYLNIKSEEEVKILKISKSL